MELSLNYLRNQSELHCIVYNLFYIYNLCNLMFLNTSLPQLQSGTPWRLLEQKLPLSQNLREGKFSIFSIPQAVSWSCKSLSSSCVTLLSTLRTHEIPWPLNSLNTSSWRPYIAQPPPPGHILLCNCVTEEILNSNNFVSDPNLFL